jgi:hypothetical protein
MGIIVADAAVLLHLLTTNVLDEASGVIVPTTAILFLAAALLFLMAAVIFVHSIAPAMLCRRAPAFYGRLVPSDAIDGFRLREREAPDAILPQGFDRLSRAMGAALSFPRT